MPVFSIRGTFSIRRKGLQSQDATQAAIPLRSAETELPNAIELQDAAVNHIAVMHQFHCTKCLNRCKTK